MKREERCHIQNARHAVISSTFKFAEIKPLGTPNMLQASQLAKQSYSNASGAGNL